MRRAPRTTRQDTNKGRIEASVYTRCMNELTNERSCHATQHLQIARTDVPRRQTHGTALWCRVRHARVFNNSGYCGAMVASRLYFLMSRYGFSCPWRQFVRSNPVFT